MNSPTTELQTYINIQREKGVTDDILYDELLRSGWPHETLAQVLQVATPTGDQLTTQSSSPSLQNVSSGATSPIEKSLYRGRLNRSGFLMAHLYILAYFVVAILIVVLGQRSTITNVIGYLMGGVGVLLIMILPFLFYARRWHDINQSGWLSLLLLIPGAGLPIMIILAVMPGTDGVNKYGSTPQRSLSPLSVYGFKK